MNKNINQTQKSTIPSNTIQTKKNENPQESEDEQILGPIPTDFKIEGLTAEQQQYLTTQILRQTPEYEAAWSLELWKKNQQRIFVEHLEKQRKKLESEWKHQLQLRDDKRKEILQNEQKRIEKLGQNLEKLIQETQQKQLQLTQNEKELALKKSQLESDYNRKISDMKHEIKLNKDETAHIVNLERQNIKELQEKCDHLTKRNKFLEDKNQDLIDQLRDMKKEFSTTDQSKLMNENESLKNQITELTASKAKYKLQWKKATQSLQKQKRNHEIQIQQFMDRERQMFLDLQREWQTIRQDGTPMGLGGPTPYSNWNQNVWTGMIPYGQPNLYPSFGGHLNLNQPHQIDPSVVNPMYAMNQLNPIPSQTSNFPQSTTPQDKETSEPTTDLLKKEIEAMKQEALSEQLKKQPKEQDLDKEKKDKKEDKKPIEAPVKGFKSNTDKKVSPLRPDRKDTTPKKGRAIIKKDESDSRKDAKNKENIDQNSGKSSKPSSKTSSKSKPSSKASEKKIENEIKETKEIKKEENNIGEEIKRITREKARLLQSGAYDETSPIIQQLNEKLQQLIIDSSKR